MVRDYYVKKLKNVSFKNVSVLKVLCGTSKEFECVFKTLSSICDRAFFSKIVNGYAKYLCKKLCPRFFTGFWR